MKPARALVCSLLTVSAPLLGAPPSHPPAAANEATAAETLAADTLRTTAHGHSYIAPVGWSMRTSGHMTVLAAPEGDSRIAVIDAAGTDPDAAVAMAWAAYDAKPRWPLKQASDRPARNGW